MNSHHNNTALDGADSYNASITRLATLSCVFRLILKKTSHDRTEWAQFEVPFKNEGKTSFAAGGLVKEVLRPFCGVTSDFFK